MTYTATVTSKRQITIPVALCDDFDLRRGQKLVLSVDGYDIKMTPMESLIERLAGKYKVPKKLQGIDIDKAIEEGKRRYFREKYKKFLKGK